MAEPLPPPSIETLAAEAAAHYGTTLPPARADAIAGDVGRMLAAVAQSAPRLAFEDDPTQFAAALRASAR